MAIFQESGRLVQALRERVMKTTPEPWGRNAPPSARVKGYGPRDLSETSRWNRAQAPLTAFVLSGAFLFFGNACRKNDVALWANDDGCAEGCYTYGVNDVALWAKDDGCAEGCYAYA